MSEKLQCDAAHCDVIVDPSDAYVATVTTAHDDEPASPFVVHACCIVHLADAVQQRHAGFQEGSATDGAARGR